jgi:hypothetical protein
VDVPADINARLGGSTSLSDDDRKTILHIAASALNPYQQQA